LLTLLRAVVVHHQVNVESAWQARGDFVQEAQELLVPVAAIAVADGDAAGNVQSRNSEVPPWRS
jgi:hypothetical protein